MTQTASTLFLAEANVISVENFKSPAPQQPQRFKPKSHRQLQIVWRNVIGFVVLHSLAIYGFFVICKHAKLATVIFLLIAGYLGALGITAGAHRLWAHKCYKAKWPMRLLLMLFQTMAFQNHIYEWARDHRVHHKFTDTDADPHNSKRGFFFSHMGWLMVRKHRDVSLKGKLIDMSDLEQDPIVMWQKRNYLILMPICTFVLPTIVPYYFWNETLGVAFVSAVFRYVLSLNFTWLVNSAAHIWGMKPYDKNISAAENLTVAALTIGEGFHNYHHSFPWDYKAAELGSYTLNLSTAFIDACACFGLAYDMKVATDDMVARRARRTGDGSHDSDVWGWDDADMTGDEKRLVNIINKASD